MYSIPEQELDKHRYPAAGSCVSRAGTAIAALCIRARSTCRHLTSSVTCCSLFCSLLLRDVAEILDDRRARDAATPRG